MVSLTEAPLKRFDKMAIGGVCIVLALAFAYLTCYSLFYTSVIDPDLYFAEHILRRQDVLWPNVLALIIGFGLFRILLRFERRLSLRFATVVMLGFIGALGTAWVLLMQATPRADAVTIYRAATALINGDDSSFLKTDSYFHIYPHQVGYLLFSECLQRLFGEHGYLSIGLVNVAALVGAYGAVLDITWKTLRERRTQLCVIGLLGLCAQPVLYCTYLYGNLPGLALALWSVGFTMRWIRQGRARQWITACALAIAAVTLKLNFMIVAIALAILLCFYAISARRLRALPFALCLLLLPPLFMSGAQRLLEARTGASFGRGTPQIAWLAMGLQEGSRAAGWYNQYTGTLLHENDFDSDKAATQAVTDIENRLSVFASDPSYAASFFHSKLVTQWAEPTFESVWINKTAKHLEGRDPLVSEWLDGPLSAGLEAYMKGYTLLLYAFFSIGIIGFAIARTRGAEPQWQNAFGLWAFSVTILGGFAYHMLFEAKSQYLFIYLPMMLPFAGRALAHRFEKPFWRRS